MNKGYSSITYDIKEFKKSFKGFSPFTVLLYFFLGGVIAIAGILFLDFIIYFLLHNAGALWEKVY